jgi:nitric oxide reductase
MVEPIFTPEAVKNLQPYIQKTVDGLLDELKSKGCADGPVDLVQEFALPVPSYVSHLHGLIVVLAHSDTDYLHNSWSAFP